MSTDSAGDGRNADSTPLASETEDGDEPKAGHSRFACVSAEVGHTCEVRKDGFVSCWGGNEDGLATPPEGEFASVSAGMVHPCGERMDGSVACWAFALA